MILLNSIYKSGHGDYIKIYSKVFVKQYIAV
ncbi:MAG: hypothetical protein PWQ96_1949 [Clostridia bacterium]|jgi:hypothetical protein|nr:hypothetical protein [Clostridiales bacterium]MDK2986305.1 hypothetical protein [Clostridia bacterium]